VKEPTYLTIAGVTKGYWPADDPAIVEALRESRVLKGCKILLYALKRIRCAGNGECKFSVHDSDCPKGIADKAISRYDEWLRVCIEKGK